MRKISVVIANRHQTSISLEDEFYEELLRIAHEQNQSLNQLITRIDAQKQISNLSSAIRIYILNELKQKCIDKGYVITNVDPATCNKINF